MEGVGANLHEEVGELPQMGAVPGNDAGADHQQQQGSLRPLRQWESATLTASGPLGLTFNMYRTAHKAQEGTVSVDDLYAAWKNYKVQVAGSRPPKKIPATPGSRRGTLASDGSPLRAPSPIWTPQKVVDRMSSQSPLLSRTAPPKLPSFGHEQKTEPSRGIPLMRPSETGVGTSASASSNAVAPRKPQVKVNRKWMKIKDDDTVPLGTKLQICPLTGNVLARVRDEPLDWFTFVENGPVSLQPHEQVDQFREAWIFWKL